MVVAQIGAVLTIYRRMPGFVAISMLLPTMFFFFFGLPHVNQHLPNGRSFASYIMASLGAYAVSNVLVYNIGIGIANQRARKLDLLQRATPLPGWVAMLAGLVVGLLLGTIALLLLFAVAAVGGVRLPVTLWATLLVWLVVGSIPMLGLGLAIGYGGGENTAPALASLIYLPMSFASGLFIPLNQMPDVVQKIAVYLPLYHYGQLAWNTVGAGDEALWKAILGVAIWSVLLLGLSARLYRQDQLRKFA
jgi:ABC-2 type transport system permease protein